ncbi:DNA mismatch repair protein MutT [Motiliproteus sp. MSK22-1]|nr:DNA mismatch repair protein MutT [Motiliproteus sp. MSK22-1]
MNTNAADNPWTTLASKLIYENPWLRVREDRVINPNGGEGIYGVIKFSNQAIGIIPIDEEDHTWLVGQYRYPLNRYSWEIPMGGHPIGADPQAGAIRELAEETGLRAKQLEEIIQVDISNSVTDEKGIVYVATQLTRGKTDFDETEDLAIRRVPVDQAISWAMNGNITDGLSVAGLLKLAILRAKYDINSD